MTSHDFTYMNLHISHTFIWNRTHHIRKEDIVHRVRTESRACTETDRDSMAGRGKMADMGRDKMADMDHMEYNKVRTEGTLEDKAGSTAGDRAEGRSNTVTGRGSMVRGTVEDSRACMDGGREGSMADTTLGRVCTDHNMADSTGVDRMVDWVCNKTYKEGRKARDMVCKANMQLLTTKGKGGGTHGEQHGGQGRGHGGQQGGGQHESSGLLFIYSETCEKTYSNFMKQDSMPGIQ